MTSCFFVSDLHGSLDRYRKLFDAICAEKPDAVFMGGDLLPSGLLLSGKHDDNYDDFLADILAVELEKLRKRLGPAYPRVFAIMGNDDLRAQESGFIAIEKNGLLEYVQGRRVDLNGHAVYGYGYVPPTPFLLKDWERYDVSRYVDPGCVSPEKGARSVPVPPSEVRYATIKDDLDRLFGNDDLTGAVCLFHAPPYETKLDRAALDGKMIDHVPLDVHVGSIAMARFIEEKQPLVTLHGHIHESARLTGSWRDGIGRTHLFSAAHDGPELALVRFNPADPASAARVLL